MVLFAAADAPLPEIAEVVPPSPLSARAIRGAEDQVRVHFSKPHAYFLGAHTGCSCGFQYGEGIDEDDAGRASVRELGAYLAAIVGAHGAVELYACWNGDEAEPALTRAHVTAAYFTGDAAEFALDERAFMTVQREES